MHRVTEYAELELDPGSAILPDMVLDTAREHVYVLSETKVCNCFCISSLSECRYGLKRGQTDGINYVLM